MIEQEIAVCDSVYLFKCYPFDLCIVNIFDFSTFCYEYTYLAMLFRIFFSLQHCRLLYVCYFSSLTDMQFLIIVLFLRNS